MTSFAPHKFFVSKTNVEYNPLTQGFEVTCKFFTDDLEKVLGSTDEKPIHLGDSREMSNVDELLERYIGDHLKLTFDDQLINLRFVGKEVESDLTYCYFEFFRSSQFHVLKVENTFFYEHFPEQQNILDFKVNAGSNTLILTKTKSTDVIYP